MYCENMGMCCLANHNELLENALRMPSSDMSDFSGSDSEGGVPVSLNCGACWKSLNRLIEDVCDQEERTCPTCTKKAHKLLMSAILVEPAKTMPSEAAESSSVTLIPTNEVAGEEIGNGDGNGVDIGDDDKVNDDT